MKQFVVLLLISLICLPAVAQYAPQAGVTGSTAISRDDNRIVGWANGCTVERGWLDVADKGQGKVSQGSDANAIGKSNNYIVSLGDGGTAVLTFETALYNGSGYDFVIFENGFVNPADPEEAFLELAFVEVSSDGVHYVRFPASSLTDTPQVPGSGVYMNARKVNNLAGKYRLGYGTPFDLEELKDSVGLDVDNVTHIRLVDVVGSLEGNSTYDKDGNKINDPYPTPFPSGGFDLDAVGAVHMKGRWPASVHNMTDSHAIQLYPNPANEILYVEVNDIAVRNIAVTDVTGKLLQEQSVNSNAKVKVDVRHHKAGIYYLILTDKTGKAWVERFAKY